MALNLSKQTIPQIATPIPVKRIGARAGLPLAVAGGLPEPKGGIEAAKKKVALDDVPSIHGNLSPSLASFLRPQAAYRWLLPYLASITPQYIESILRGALAGNHVQAWELFDLMMDTDPEISACVQEYNEGVLSKKFVFEPYHEEDEEPSDEAIEKCKLVSAALRGMRPDMSNDENDLRNTARDILAARFHGQSLLEIDYTDNKTGQLNIKQVPELGNVLCPRSTYWVHPVCYAWSMGGRLGLRLSVTDSKDVGRYAKQTKLGKDFGNIGSMVEPPAWNWITSQPRPDLLTDLPEDKFLIGIHKAKTGSVLSASCMRPLAWWWCASNFCGDWLLNYAQLFGIPFRKASYGANTSEAQKAEIRQMLQSCGASGYIMLPEGAELEFMNSGSSGSDSPQAFLFHFADSQKRKVILHQTMTGGQHDSMGKGGGKAFGEVEGDTKTQCINAGAKTVEGVINLQWIPSLLKLNYGDGGDLEAPTMKMVSHEVGNLADAQRDSALAQIADIPQSYIHTKYGIPKPKAGEPIAGVDIGVLGAQAAAAEKAQKQQAENAKAQAKIAQQQKPNAGTQNDQGGSGDGQGEGGGKQQIKDKGTGTEARREIQAATGKTSGAGCLMAMMPKDFSDEFVKWSSKNIDQETLTADGIEEEPHVTVLYGFDLGFDPEQLKAIAGGKIQLTIGKLSRFECPEYDVIKFEIVSPRLKTLNKKIASRFGDDINPSEHVYSPHLTVAYVTKGTNKDIEGSEWEGKKITVNQLLYSEPEHTNRVAIALTARQAKIQAASAATPVEDASKALHGTVEPMLERLQAIKAVKDKASRLKLLKKFLKDHAQLTSAMIHDDSLSKAITPELVQQFLKGLKSKG